jgi:tyrosyl-tRNA synthetase
VGDFTGMVGDPDKMSTRKPLTKEKVQKNSRNWKQQAGKVLSFTGKNPAKILFNSTWLSKLNFSDLVKIASHLTYQQIIKRDLFQKRIKQGIDIHLHEILYPVMQAYDCVHMDVDLEVGGSDQLFNILVGRNLMKRMKKKEKFVLTTRLLVDSRGEKAGKTTSNALFLNLAPVDMYGGIMAFSDDLIIPAFELLTTIPMSKVKVFQKQLKTDPMKLKKRLAFEIVKLYHDEKAAASAQGEFEKVFQKKEAPTTLNELKIKSRQLNIIDLLIKAKLAPSRSEAKRLVLQGGVDVEGKTIKNQNSKIKIKDGAIVRVGKRKFAKIIKP